jgi:hypothetical protein
MKRIIYSIIAFFTTLGLFWIGGYAFDKREFMLAWAIYSAGAVALMTWTFPGWKD